MYLAIKEILHNKLRYLLVVVTVFLIGYMIFFMTSLAVGLVRVNRLAADNWNASSVVVSSYSNDNLVASAITEKQYDGKLSSDSAPVGYMSAVTQKSGSSDKVNVSIFGQNFDSFIAPKVSQGRLPSNNHEVVVDSGLKNYQIHLGDKIKLNGSNQLYTIVGLSDDAKLFTVPVIYTSLETYWHLNYGDSGIRNISALVLRNDKTVTGSGLTQISENRMIAQIPGYTPEVNVFMGMIIAMVVITFLVVGIFLYIITIQKIGLYGVMRAQGIATKTIVSSLFWQIFVLSAVGVVLALAFVKLTQVFLPATLFFYPSWLAYGGLAVAIIIMALAGGLISLRKVMKIDPLAAIGE